MFDTFHPSKLNQTRHFFFTGKGGVGKTSTACATAVKLAADDKQVLIISTDPASNLEDVFEVSLSNKPTEIPNVPGLYAANLDPEQAAADYRERVIGPYRNKLPKAVVDNMEEQLSGACTVEIAAFDEFTNILSNRRLTEQFDHIIFDTAPTGHTLRLLQLPTAWTTFLDDNTHGASCLGPLSGLEEKKELYAKTVQSLSNSDETTLILVSRPEYSSLEEAARASNELADLGIDNQALIINGVHRSSLEDPVSNALSKKQQQSLATIPDSLKNVRTYELPLVPYNLTGLESLKNLFSDNWKGSAVTVHDEAIAPSLPSIHAFIEDVSKKQSGVILTMGKGGVGKTTMAAAIAVGLANRGLRVHLTTTDPAAHLSMVMGEDSGQENLSISRIDPKVEVEAYRNEVLTEAAKSLDEESLEFMEEELNSPCTEEIAVFRAFAKVVEKANDEFVVVDTAPTGHTLLLLDAAESYHKEVSKRSSGDVPDAVKKLLPRLRDPNETDVVLVTLAEATPVFEASRLQDDLRRADIHPRWWIINQSFQATETTDPILKGRAAAEQKWIQKVNDSLAENCAIVPWQAEETIGVEVLNKLSK